MSANEAEAQKAVTAAIASAGSNSVSQMVDVGLSCQRKRLENREINTTQLAREEQERAAKNAKQQGKTT
ncbi:uncharacterized protein N7479_000202 [Penicillium vulpinum]|uniref:uncharacterized protein n=1 Tax=Penicillium vulpinum TaxID=29845 RepID=UPI00254926D4|nr:uncharacterized protein N7479_000202 [Penicillium vulpinum]KAJ5970284.1 hypothetical protein N7479_000202 [Penicillium vulpinum]